MNHDGIHLPQDVSAALHWLQEIDSASLCPAYDVDCLCVKEPWFFLLFRLMKIIAVDEYLHVKRKEIDTGRFDDWMVCWQMLTVLTPVCS